MAAGWVAVLALVMRLGGAAPAAPVLFPPAGLVAALPEGVAVPDAGRISLTLRGDEAGLAATLHALGATLVRPTGLPGCAGAPGQARGG